jgi:probable rRNA maturation factor
VPIDVTVSSPGRRAPLAAARVRALVALVCAGERVPHATFDVTFLEAPAMARLNEDHLGHAGATDIITFELPARDGTPGGDIYVCPEIARAHARDWAVPVREEYARLVIHGVLHALGHEHPEDEDRLRSPMWRAQERYLARAKARGLA